MDVETGRAADTVVKPSPPSAARITLLDEVEQWIEMLGDDYEVARLVEGHGHSMPAARQLCERRREIVWCRACGLKWRRIGERVGRSHEWARSRYNESLERIAARLNMGVLKAPRGMMEIE